MPIMRRVLFWPLLSVACAEAEPHAIPAETLPPGSLRLEVDTATLTPVPTIEDPHVSGSATEAASLRADLAAGTATVTPRWGGPAAFELSTGDNLFDLQAVSGAWLWRAGPGIRQSATVDRILIDRRTRTASFQGSEEICWGDVCETFRVTGTMGVAADTEPPAVRLIAPGDRPLLPWEPVVAELAEPLDLGDVTSRISVTDVFSTSALETTPPAIAIVPSAWWPDGDITVTLASGYPDLNGNLGDTTSLTTSVLPRVQAATLHEFGSAENVAAWGVSTFHSADADCTAAAGGCWALSMDYPTCVEHPTSGMLVEIEAATPFTRIEVRWRLLQAEPTSYAHSTHLIASVAAATENSPSIVRAEWPGTDWGTVTLDLPSATTRAGVAAMLSSSACEETYDPSIDVTPGTLLLDSVQVR